MKLEPGTHGRDWVAIILAIGTVSALNVITLGVLWTAVFGKSNVPGGLSENATQILTGVMGGAIGVLGSYLGFRAGTANGKRGVDTTPPVTSPDEIPPFTPLVRPPVDVDPG